MKSNKKVGYFDSASLTILPVSFDKEPTETEFRDAVYNHVGAEQFYPVTVPRDPKSTAVWLSFPQAPNGDRLFYVCFPSTKDGKKCWQIGMSNKGMKFQNQPDLKANPFAALAAADIKTVTPQELFHTKCPEAVKLGPTHRVVESIWKNTQGNPCRCCNRPKGCKLTIKS